MPNPHNPATRQREMCLHHLDYHVLEKDCCAALVDFYRSTGPLIIETHAEYELEIESRLLDRWLTTGEL